VFLDANGHGSDSDIGSGLNIQIKSIDNCGAKGSWESGTTLDWTVDTPQKVGELLAGCVTRELVVSRVSSTQRDEYLLSLALAVRDVGLDLGTGI
jgi:hypothetical protein